MLPEYLSLSFFFAGDAPFCTPEQHKECAEPALGQYQGPDGMGVFDGDPGDLPGVGERWGQRGGGQRRGERC